MNDYDGEDRRINGKRDHDLLTRIDVNVSALMESFDNHVDDDEKSFTRLDERTSRLEKFMWVTVGIVVFVEFISKFLQQK